MTRSFLVPEVMQASVMDCGPAALKAVLEGFGIFVPYDQLRDRCETDVDGTSIDALAALGHELGLESHEILVSRDSFLLKEARCLPAIVVTRAGGGQLHFIVVWRTLGPFVQVMDPGSGRRWLRKRRFLQMMPDISIGISEAKWRRWAASRDGLDPLRARMRAVGIRGAAADGFIADAESDATFRSFAALDAGVRMLAALHESRVLRRGEESVRLLRSALCAQAASAGVARERTQPQPIPRSFFWAESDQPGKLRLFGSVVVHFAARREHASAAAETLSSRAVPAGTLAQRSPIAILWRIARHHMPRHWPLIVCASLVSVLLTPFEALLLGSLLDAQRYLSLDYQRFAGGFALLIWMAAGLMLEGWAALGLRRLGDGLEARLRVALSEKIPLTDDKYLRTRPASDVASRGHSIHLLHDLPTLWAQAARAALTVVVNAAGLLWLFPRGAPWILGAVVLAVALPALARRPMTETSLRVRTHGSALDGFYLDAMLGAGPVRVHGAERSVFGMHAELLSEWLRTRRALQLQVTAVTALQALTVSGIAVGLVVGYIAQRGHVQGALILAIWALRMASAAQELAAVQLVLRTLRGVTLRLISPLMAAETNQLSESPPVLGVGRGVQISLRAVTARQAGRDVLTNVSLEIPAGGHVAIVGKSGAGKSSLLGILLGWFGSFEHSVFVDGQPLTAATIASLREHTAWVDPGLRIWESSLYENLAFGADDEPGAVLSRALHRADLYEVLERLPEGMQANLGEAGVRLSGGQGQRVRLGRALMRESARLVLLDEPFRGLERERRRELLRRARSHWQQASLLFVSHDVSDALEFPRVLVVDAGAIVEDGDPAQLLADPHSQYAQLVRAEQALHTALWSGRDWQKRVVERGRVIASEAE